MGTEMTRLFVGLFVAASFNTLAGADTPSPLAGILAPDAAGTVFHAALGWQPGSARLRVLDDAGRPLCCLRVAPAPLAEPSDLQSGDAGRGARHAVTAEGPLARRLAEGPLLAPVLQDGVKVVQGDSDRTRLKKRGQRWSLERCVTQEGLRLTISSTTEPGATTFYFPLGYDVEPTCR
jgi:hypothetical protein